MALQLALVAANPGFDLGERRAESRMGVGSEPMALQILSGREGYVAVHAKAVAVATDHHLGVAAAVEVLANAGDKFGGDPLTQGLADVDMFAGNLDFHTLSPVP